MSDFNKKTKSVDYAQVVIEQQRSKLEAAELAANNFAQLMIEMSNRAESAEAQLAAVRGPYTAEDAAIVVRAWQTLSDDARDAAWGAVTLTAPSPGAGEKT